MKRWVTENEGKVEIIGTSGWTPPGAICEAKEEWTPESITYDKKSGVVFLDPEKVRSLLDAKEEADVALKNKIFRQRLKRMAPTLFYISIAFSVGYFVAKVIF